MLKLTTQLMIHQLDLAEAHLPIMFKLRMVLSGTTRIWWSVTLPLVLLIIASCGSADTDVITPSSSEQEELLTVEDAQERLAFDLVLPATVTEGLDLAGVIVGDNPQGDATPSTDSARSATLVFSSSTPGERVLVNQTTYPSSVPDAQMNQDQALKSSDRQPDEPLPPAEQGPITIDGHEVLRTKIHVMSDEGPPMPVLTYSWDEDGVHIDMTAPVSGDITEEMTKTLVAALLANE